MDDAAQAPAKPASEAKPAAKSELEKGLDEFRIQTRNMGLRADSPRKAKDGGAKSSAAFHGRLFENLRNNFFDAVPHEVRQRGGSQGLLRRNQYGFNITGPVVIPRVYNRGKSTYFTVTYEGMREKIGRSYLRTIPTLPERTGDWSQVVDLAGDILPIYDPQTTATNPAFNPAEPVTTENLQYPRQPFPENRIPASRLDAAAQRALAAYPSPNSDAGPFFRNNFFIFSPEQNKADGLNGRVDHTLNDRNRIGFAMNWSNGFDQPAKWFATAANPGSPDRNRRTRRGTLEHVFTLSPRSINTLTVDMSTDQFENVPDQNETGDPFPRYSFSPYLSMGRSYPISRNSRTNLVVTNGFSTRWKEHRLRFILQGIRERVNSYWPQYPSGSFRFSAGYTSLPGIVNTGHAFASFLLGAPDYAERSVVISPSYFRRNRGAILLRDQWEIRKGLTLSLGLNIDGSTPRVERYDRQSSVVFDRINPANGRPGALVAANHDGYGRAFQPFLVKPEPSASLSWNVLGRTRTVMRAGYSRSYSAIPIYLGQWGTQAFNGTPTWVSLNPQLQPALILANGFPPSRTFPDLRPDSANNTVADLLETTGIQPTYQSGSLSVEHELKGQIMVTAGVGHSEGRNLLLSNGGSNPNAIPLSALEYRDRLNDENFNRSQRPFPQYQRFDVYSSWPEGRYKRDAAYVRIEKRTSAGLSLSAYYEFSKQMDNYSGPYGVQDYYNRQKEWALTSSNNPHRFTLTYMYELPIGANKMFFTVTDWRRHIFDGWSISGQTTMTSGEPLALRPQFNNTGGVVDALNVNTVPGVDPHSPKQGPEMWFNPEAFAQPADFTIGDVSRTHPQLRMPNNQNHDLSLNKRVAVSAERSVEFSMVGLNFVNHAVWTDPDTIIGPASSPNVNAGKIIGSRGGRIIQLGLKFSF